MNKTSIGWTDFTSNPIRARHRETGKAGHFCEKVSPGCAHCYASEWNENRYGTGLAFLPANRDKVDVYLNEDELHEWSKPKYAGKRVFVADMTDLFAEWVPDHMIARVWMAMAYAPHVTFQVLTKRPERMREWATKWIDLSGEAGDFKGVRGPEATREAHRSGRGQIFADYLEGLGEPPPGAAYPTFDWMEGPRWWIAAPLQNVWLGVSVENQHWADVRIPILLDTPATVLFISAEPLLSGLRLEGYLGEEVERIETMREETGVPVVTRHTIVQGITWVIVGGESGSKRRPFDLQWAHDLKRQCDDAGVAFFAKQAGGFRSETPFNDPELDAAKAWPA